MFFGGIIQKKTIEKNSKQKIVIVITILIVMSIMLGIIVGCNNIMIKNNDKTNNNNPLYQNDHLNFTYFIGINEKDFINKYSSSLDDLWSDVFGYFENIQISGIDDLNKYGEILTSKFENVIYGKTDIISTDITNTRGIIVDGTAGCCPCKDSPQHCNKNAEGRCASSNFCWSANVKIKLNEDGTGTIIE